MDPRERLERERRYERMLEYLTRVRAVVEQVQLTPSELHEVEHLIDHGEPAEGLRTLAWIIVQEGKQVPAGVPAAIRELTASLVDACDMPPELESHALPTNT